MLPRTPINVISGDIIDAALRVHTEVGPGLLERTYERCLAYELRLRGHRVQTQLPIPVVYREVDMGIGYRIDMLVENRVIVELKTVRRLKPIHHAQLLSYLRLSKKRVGLLINFHEVHLRDGLKRLVND